ncbi:MAG: 4Fe-4S binding protein [Tepidiformaceae bacterium]
MGPVWTCAGNCIKAGEGAPQFYFDPVRCIDCRACEPYCPVDAIFSNDLPPRK